MEAFIIPFPIVRDVEASALPAHGKPNLVGGFDITTLLTLNGRAHYGIGMLYKVRYNLTSRHLGLHPQAGDRYCLCHSPSTSTFFYRASPVSRARVSLGTSRRQTCADINCQT